MDTSGKNINVIIIVTTLPGFLRKKKRKTCQSIQFPGVNSLKFTVSITYAASAIRKLRP